MKQQVAHIIIMLLAALSAKSQTTVSGVVTDGREPLAGANVFIIGTIDGCLTDSLGHFSFDTSLTGEQTLRATFIGFDDYTLTSTQLSDLTITMRERATAIDEVVVTASTYSFGKSDNFKTMDALEQEGRETSSHGVVLYIRGIRYEHVHAVDEGLTLVALTATNV